MSMTKDMHGSALQSALADTRPIKEVEWITEDIHDPNDYAKLGGIKHSFLKVTLGNANEQGTAYAIETAAPDENSGHESQTCVLVSNWSDKLRSATSPYQVFAHLGPMDLTSNTLTFSPLWARAHGIGHYDVGKCNCHHAARSMYNMCTVQDRQIQEGEMPNAHWSLTAAVASAVVPDLFKHLKSSQSAVERKPESFAASAPAEHKEPESEPKENEKTELLLSGLQLHSARSNHSPKALANLNSDSRCEGLADQFESAKQFLEDHAGEIEDAKEIAGEAIPFIKAAVKLIQKIYGTQRSSQQNKDIVAQILEYLRRLEDLTQKLPTDSVEYAHVLTFIKDKTVELDSLQVYCNISSLSEADSRIELREFFKEISKATREFEMNEKALAKGREADKLNDQKTLNDQKMRVGMGSRCLPIPIPPCPIPITNLEVPNDQNVSEKERVLELKLANVQLAFENSQLELKLAKAEKRRKCCLASWCNFGANLFRATTSK